MPTRIVLYARDIANLSGRSPRTSRRLLQKIRLSYGKEPGDFVTIEEFCAYCGLEEEKVKQFLRI